MGQPVPVTERSARPGFEEFSPVWLARPCVIGDVILPKGTGGIVVDRNPSGTYEIEFNEPVEAVLTLDGEALAGPKHRLALESIKRFGRVLSRCVTG